MFQLLFLIYKNVFKHGDILISLGAVSPWSEPCFMVLYALTILCDRSYLLNTKTYGHMVGHSKDWHLVRMCWHIVTSTLDWNCNSMKSIMFHGLGTYALVTVYISPELYNPWTWNLYCWTQLAKMDVLKCCNNLKYLLSEFMDLHMYESGWFCASYNSYICSYYIFIRFEIEPTISTDLGTHW